MKLNDLKEPVFTQMWFFKEATTVGQLRNAVRKLQQACYELEKNLKEFEK